MSIISNIKWLLIFFILSACQNKLSNLAINNQHLSLANGVMLYKEKPYSGILFSKTDTLTTYTVTYMNGKKHGKEQKFFFNGDLAELIFYSEGMKIGIHQAWWNKDQLKSVSHFDNSGNRIGTEREWYSNGQLVKEFNYTNGKQDGTQKLWDVTGKIEANYLVINGEFFGLIGSKKCKSGEYVD